MGDALAFDVTGADSCNDEDEIREATMVDVSEEEFHRVGCAETTTSSESGLARRSG